jgi:hypothetical protein
MPEYNRQLCQSRDFIGQWKTGLIVRIYTYIHIRETLIIGWWTGSLLPRGITHKVSAAAYVFAHVRPPLCETFSRQTAPAPAPRPAHSDSGNYYFGMPNNGLGQSLARPVGAAF